MNQFRPPEPCLSGRCYSPTACNGWGYCRERNQHDDGIPSAATQSVRRLLAADRRAAAELSEEDR